MFFISIVDYFVNYVNRTFDVNIKMEVLTLSEY